MNPTIISFNPEKYLNDAMKELKGIVPEGAIRLSPLTYLLPSSDVVAQILEKMPESPALRESPYIAIGLKTKIFRHTGHDKAAQVLQGIEYDVF